MDLGERSFLNENFREFMNAFLAAKCILYEQTFVARLYKRMKKKKTRRMKIEPVSVT